MIYHWIVQLLNGRAMLWLFATAFYSVITNTEYKSATDAGSKKLKGLLGYLRYRRDVVEGQPLDNDRAEWGRGGRLSGKL